MLGDVEVDDPPAVVSDYNEDEQDAEARGGHGEEIDGGQVPDMVGEERPPVWDGGECRFGSSRETVRLATSMPSFRTSPWMRGAPPKRVRGGHAGDQSPDLGVDGRATSG
jgi:hypothetical protein